MKIKTVIKNKDLKPLINLMMTGNATMYDIITTYLQCMVELDANDPPIDEWDVNTTKKVFEECLKVFNIFEFANFFASKINMNIPQLNDQP